MVRRLIMVPPDFPPDRQGPPLSIRGVSTDTYHKITGVWLGVVIVLADVAHDAGPVPLLCQSTVGIGGNSVIDQIRCIVLCPDWRLHRQHAPYVYDAQFREPPVTAGVYAIVDRKPAQWTAHDGNDSSITGLDNPVLLRARILRHYPQHQHGYHTRHWPPNPQSSHFGGS